MQPYTDRMTSTPLTKLIIRCYPGDEGCCNSYSLYEDDGITTDYEQGQYAETRLEYSLKNGRTEITIHPTQGVYKGSGKKTELSDRITPYQTWINCKSKR